MNLRPTRKNVLVRRVTVKDLPPSGLLLPDYARLPRHQGYVVALGSQCDEPELKIGSKVCFEEGVDLTKRDINGVEHLMLKQSNILAVLE
jgi:chaperonin GroES